MPFSRRTFLSLLSASGLGLASEDHSEAPSEITQYRDAATESPVFRLTDPSHTSFLPAYYGRAISKRGDFLLYASDRTGTMQAWRMDLKSGRSRQLTAADELLPASITLLPGEKSCCFVAAGVLKHLALSNLRQREIYRIPNGFEPRGGLGITVDGLHAALVERGEKKYRIALVDLLKGAAETVLEHSDEIADAIPRPGRSGILYRLGPRELRLVGSNGARDTGFRTAAGALGPALWSRDGHTADYLLFPEDRQQLHAIREYTPDTNGDALVATTSQFVHFGRNSDSSVYVGASGNKAAPYVLLLARAVKRELTLCEHRASDPAKVAPIFSPNSQRIFFHSDQHGKWAIYSMDVERIVARTEP